MRMEIFRDLWPAALVLTLTAAGAMVVVTMSAHFHATQEHALTSSSSRLSQLRTQLAELRQEEQAIRNEIAVLDRMRASGVLGDEDRLHWMEQLRRIKQAHALYALEYEISPQGLLDQEGAAGPTGRVRFHSSRMNLRMDLLHEGDLLVLLTEFGRSARAYVRTTRCAIERLPQRGQASPPAARLTAQCQLELITAGQQAQERP